MFKNVSEIPTIVQEFSAANPPKPTSTHGCSLRVLILKLLGLLICLCSKMSTCTSLLLLFPDQKILAKLLLACIRRRALRVMMRKRKYSKPPAALVLMLQRTSKSRPSHLIRLDHPLDQGSAHLIMSLKLQFLCLRRRTRLLRRNEP